MDQPDMDTPGLFTVIGEYEDVFCGRPTGIPAATLELASFLLRHHPHVYHELVSHFIERTNELRVETPLVGPESSPPGA